MEDASKMPSTKSIYFDTVTKEVALVNDSEYYKEVQGCLAVTESNICYLLIQTDVDAVVFGSLS